LAIAPLKPGALRPACDPTEFDFVSTAELNDPTEFFGQPRAVAALEFGVGIEQRGYNLFALGPGGTGKQALIDNYIAKKATEQASPADWCYVNNFEDWRKPKALQMPAGVGNPFARDMENLIDEVDDALQSMFESEEYRNRSEAIEQGLSDQQEKATEALQDKARERGLTLMRTPGGITLAPVRDGETLSPQEFQELPEEQQETIKQNIEQLQEELRKTFREAPRWQKESRRKIDELNREMAGNAVAPLIQQLRETYGEIGSVGAYLDAVEADIVENFQRFLPQEQQQQSQMAALMSGGDGSDEMPFSNRYRVNVLVGKTDDDGAPVVFENHPTYNNLIGRVEHRALQGALVTDFTMIRPGALHRANGGYVMLDALKVLSQPFAWDALKRTLKAGKIRLESLGESVGLISTASLEPEPIPLDIKVILLGEPLVYYLLAQYDPEFADLFKVQVDFDDRMDRGDHNQALYARMIAAIVRREELPHFDRDGVARVVDYSARQVDDNEKLSTHLRSVSDLLRESAYWAQQDDAKLVSAAHVQQAVDARTHRADRVRERVQEAIRRDTILIDTSGERIGQINALSVLMLGDFSFGRPSRVTARTRIGKGQVVDIEREVEMGGPIHSKGVLILSHFLGANYALDYPLSLAASLVFEQSYSGVDGDSASCAELCALLSDLAQVPIRQSLAITGSINQHGQVQAIGGVNDKIEGFFDTCNARGLSGDQGVLIPQANVKHLMLRPDVIDAVAEARFAVYPVATVGDALELLTGLPAGERDDTNAFAEGSINRRVEDRLIRYSKRMRDFGAGNDRKSGNS